MWWAGLNIGDNRLGGKISIFTAYSAIPFLVIFLSSRKTTIEANLLDKQGVRSPYSVFCSLPFCNFVSILHFLNKSYTTPIKTRNQYKNKGKLYHQLKKWSYKDQKGQTEEEKINSGVNTKVDYYLIEKHVTYIFFSQWTKILEYSAPTVQHFFQQEEYMSYNGIMESSQFIVNSFLEIATLWAYVFMIHTFYAGRPRNHTGLLLLSILHERGCHLAILRIKGNQILKWKIITAWLVVT